MSIKPAIKAGLRATGFPAVLQNRSQVANGSGPSLAHSGSMTKTTAPEIIRASVFIHDKETTGKHIHTGYALSIVLFHNGIFMKYKHPDVVLGIHPYRRLCPHDDCHIYNTAALSRFDLDLFEFTDTVNTASSVSFV